MVFESEYSSSSCADHTVVESACANKAVLARAETVKRHSSSTEVANHFQQHRVLIVDEHPLFRIGVKMWLQSKFGTLFCGEAETRLSAVRALDALKPHLVLLGLRLQGEDTIELVAQIHQMKPEIKVLVVGQSDEISLGENALRAGAHGLILKSQAPEDLQAAIETVLCGEIYLNERLTSLVLKKAYFGNTKDEVMRKLSQREVQIFAMIGLGYSTRDIATKLRLSRRTVNVHRENIKRKLVLKAAPNLVYAAITWMQNHAAPPVESILQGSFMGT